VNIFKNLFSSAIHLFYPRLCIGCGSDLLRPPALLCFHCIDSLPHTGYETIPGNPAEKIFYGRIPVTAAHSGFYFTKGALIQTLIHELKYKGNTEAGLYLGRLMGDKMQDSGRFTDIDYLIPLPLSAEKEFKRGYNQAEVICRGLSDTMNIPVMNKNIVRTRYTETQTKKHRAERWENVSGSFTINDPGAIYNKHILLVDDVITTGATLEACAVTILAAGDIRVSIATLAIASK
jgi:ComF family protein